MDFKKFKKSLDQSNIYDASEFLVDLYINNPQNFRKSLLLSNSLPEPISRPIPEKKLETLTRAFDLAAEKLSDKHIDKTMFMNGFHHLIKAIRIINENITINLEKLGRNSFLDYSLSQQLQMICIYIEDQNRLFNEQGKDLKGFKTGMESQVANYEVDDAKEIKVSKTDNLEALIEITDTLFRYLYFRSKCSEPEENFNHKNISPYGIGSLKEIMQLAHQRNLLVNTWGKYKFRDWSYKVNDNNIIFQPSSKEDYLKERIATDRYIYRDHINMQQSNMKYKKENQKSAIHFGSIAKGLDVPEAVFNISKKDFYKSNQIFKNLMKAQLISLDETYLNLEYKGLKVTDLLKGFEYLFTVCMIYRDSALSNFDQEDTSHYNKLSPIIDKAVLVNQLSDLYELDSHVAELVIDTFTFLKIYKLDVFSQPLIQVSDDKVIFCPSLIIQMNIVRIIEMLATEWDKKISNKGEIFEKDLRFILSFNPFIEVNTKKIEFKAYDGREVEFDFIAKFEDQILLIEFKHVKRPFSDKMQRNALGTLDEGITQVNRREKIIMNDWDLIKERCSFDLPEKPPSTQNIIKLVCTNILDFTSVIRNGVEIIDSSSIIKFFMSPDVKGYENGDEVREIAYKNLWEKGAPTVREFRIFLKNPVAIQPFKDCYEGVIKPIQKLSIEENNIGFYDYSLVKDPYYEFGTKLPTNNKKIKIGRNKKCPCGSDKKYKKCCGK